jgi:hypothetical protein
MPSTDTKPELTAKASMAQPVSQPAVYANGLTRLIKVRLHKIYGASHIEKYFSLLIPIHSGLKRDALRIICILSKFQLGEIL